MEVLDRKPQSHGVDRPGRWPLACVLQGKGRGPVPDIYGLAEELLADASLTPADLNELRTARWLAPPGVQVRRIVWRRAGQTKRFVESPMLARADRACAVSPFVDRGGLAEMLKAGARSVSLLTTDLAGAECGAYDGVTFRIDAAPEPETPVSVELQRRGCRRVQRAARPRGSRQAPGRYRRAIALPSCWEAPT